MINLASTNQQLHDIEHVTITGQAGVTLISESTKNLLVSKSCLNLLGSFLMYVNDHVLPETPFPDAYHTDDDDKLR